MLVSALGVARMPPEKVAKDVTVLEKKYEFGVRLRSSKNPDFISRAIVGDFQDDVISRYFVSSFEL